MNPKYLLERSLIGKMLKDFFLYEKHKLEDPKQYDIVTRFPTSYSFVWMSHCSTASIWFRSSLIPEEAGERGPSSPKYQSNSSSSIPSESTWRRLNWWRFQYLKSESMKRGTFLYKVQWRLFFMNRWINNPKSQDERQTLIPPKCISILTLPLVHQAQNVMHHFIRGNPHWLIIIN